MCLLLRPVKFGIIPILQGQPCYEPADHDSHRGLCAAKIFDAKQHLGDTANKDPVGNQHIRDI